ncbi:MAG: urea carboxylase-associated family protein [Pseudomonadota bacterium]
MNNEQDVNRDQGEPDGTNATLTTPISPDGRPIFGERYEVAARTGRAVSLLPGEVLRVINTHGTQVCDFWAFNSEDAHEFLSMEHMHAQLETVIPRSGQPLCTNRRQTLLTFLSDTSPGIHDTVIASCDLHRYRSLGVDAYHDNCTDNLRMAMLAIGHRAVEIPSPFNIWMNIPIGSDHNISWLPPVSQAGDYVEFRAERACIAVMSACPQDLLPVNGEDNKPVNLHFEVFE